MGSTPKQKPTLERTVPLPHRGRRQLVAETSRWERFVRAITGVLRPAEPEEGQ